MIPETFTGTVKTDRFEMDYFRFGKGEKVMVFLMGLTVRSIMNQERYIAKTHEIFADDYTVYVFDRKRNMKYGYNMYDMAEDTADAMMQLGLKDVYMLGESQGGMIAQILTLNHPELVKKLVLVSTSSYMLEHSNPDIYGCLEMAKTRNVRKLYELMLHRIYTQEFLDRFGEGLYPKESKITDADLDRFVILADGNLAYDITDRLKEIKIPVLVIAGKEDKMLDPNRAKELAEAGGFELYMYDHYGHALYDEAPDFKERVKTFFDR